MTESFNRSVTHLIFARGKLAPDSLALSVEGRDYTYRELFEKSARIRSLLDSKLGAHEKRIGIVADSSFETYASILGILFSGRAYVPVLSSSPHERNAYCLDHADVHAIISSDAKTDFRKKRIDLGEIPTSSDLKPPAPIKEDDLAYILFTSGSTGVPKGVPISYGNLSGFFRAFLDSGDMQFSPKDRFLQMFDLTFDLSVMSMLTPWLVGGSCHCVPQTGHGFLNISSLLEEKKITVALMVPSVIVFLEKYFDQLSLPSLRYSLFCGEALPARTVVEWGKRAPNARVFNVYGPTEATIFCSSFEIKSSVGTEDAYNGVVSIGGPMKGTEFIVVDEKLVPVKGGEKGELCLFGSQVTEGYWNSPDKTREAFAQLSALSQAQRVYRTGDIVFERAGNFFYCGRKDHQIKMGGFRVELGEIEYQAKRVTGVSEAAAVAKRDGDGNVVLHLFAQSKNREDRAWLGSFKQSMKQNLPHYMVPQKIHILDELPLNPNGKIDRNGLLALTGESET
jgi:D-alanine--poly(phosphoribitol) ligase subunit 1